MTRDLSRLLRPGSVAVFGGNWAANVVEQLRKIGFAGAIWPVHPSREEIHGIRCFRSVAELPGVPDAAFVGVNRERTVEIADQLGAIGCGGAVCFASGFLESEGEGTSGRRLQACLVEAARDMPILGPNCYGFVNYLDGAALWPDQHGGLRCERGVAILTQSSNITINMTMQRRGLPVAYVVTAGNQAQTGLAEIGMALLADPRVTALGLYIEGIGDAARFEAMAARAKDLGKSIVALKAGISDHAQVQTLSHTASLAGFHAGAMAFLERNGVVFVRSITVFLEALKLLHVHGALPGNRLASISCSGGEASLMADLAVGRQVVYPALTAEQTGRLRAVLGPMVSLANPLDYHTYIWGKPEAMAEAFTAMIDAPVDLAMFVLDWPRADRCAATGWDTAVDAIRQAARNSGTRTAIVASMPENMPEELAAELVGEGIVPLLGMEEAILAAEAAHLAGEALRRPLPAPAHETGVADEDTIVMSEADAKVAMALFGLPVPMGHVCHTIAEAVAAGTKIGYPVALKGLGVAHKTETGAVVVGLPGPAELATAAASMEPNVDGFLVEKMISAEICELIVGVVRDPAHGLVLTIGAGGILTELMADIASLILPATDDEIARKIAGLRVGRLMAGYRGRPSANMGKIVEAIQAIAAYAAAERHRLVELDVNPLIITPSEAVAADALIRLAGAGAVARKGTAA